MFLKAIFSCYPVTTLKKPLEEANLTNIKKQWNAKEILRFKLNFSKFRCFTIGY